MSDTLAWGLGVVKSVQAVASPGFTVAMKALSFVGSLEFYLAFLPLVYWCVNRRKGVRLGIVVLLSSFLNLWLKELIMQPRPYQMDNSVMLDTAESYGLPSGHAQGSGVFWGMIAVLFPRALFTVAAVALPLLVGFSRIYLGVHFPTDVFAGWGLALVCVALFHFLGERAGALFKSLERRFKIIILAAIALGMNYLMTSDTMIAGAFFGSGVGFVITSEDMGFSAGGRIGTKILRYCVGIATTLVLYLGPKYLIGDAFPSQAGLIRFLRYGIVGIWVTLGAPWLFLKLKLADRED